MTNNETSKWNSFKIKDVCELSSQKIKPEESKFELKCIELEHIESQSGRLLGYVSSKEVKSTKNVFGYGDVLYGKLRPYLKKYYYAQFDGVCSTEIWVLKPKENMSSLYLYYLIQTDWWNHIANISTGSSMPRADWKYVSQRSISIPDVTEQEKIASILSTWDEAIELYKKNEKLSKLRLRGVIQRIFENQSDWKEYRLDEIAEIYQPKTLSAKNMTGGEYRVFGANGYIGYHNEYNHEQSQVTVSCRGENTGTVNLVEGKTWITGNSMVLNVDVNSNLNKKFLYFYLKNQNLKYLVTGSGQPQIIRRDIARHRIKLPSSNKQEEIVEFLDVLEKEIELTKKLIVQLQEQKRGLMQLLLTGKVRV